MAIINYIHWRSLIAHAQLTATPRALLAGGVTMALVNTSVYCISDRRTILPWTIQAVDPPDTTFHSFYHSHVSRHLNASENSPLHLKETFVGSKKETLDKVDPDLVLKDVTAAFGPFVKYVVSSVDEEHPGLPSLSGWYSNAYRYTSTPMSVS